MNRRRFLHTIALSGVAATAARVPLLGAGKPLASTHSTLLAGGGNPLRFPPEWNGTPLVAAQTKQNVWSDAKTDLWTIGGSWPGPTIRAKRGSTFNARLVNMLAEPTIIHWHGLIVPHEMDGHPMQVVGTEGTYDYSFPILNRAGTYWYHPHPHHRTAIQAYRGMAGLFIVEDDAEKELGLPDGEHDIPLALQDRRITPSRQFTYEVVTDDDHLQGFLGDTVFVNGTPDPYLEVDKGLYRFRILNGSNARIFYLSFTDGRPFHIIASDGGLLDKPYSVTLLSISPGERFEILVDFSGDEIGTSVMLRSENTGAGAGYPPPQGAELPIIRFDVVKEASKPFTIPQTLVPYELYREQDALRERDFILSIRHEGSVGNLEVGHFINDKEFEMERIDETVPMDQLEIWSFRNSSLAPHPMHVHGVQFQVLDRAGNANLVPRDRGWKDTVLVLPYQMVRVLVRFNRYPGIYLVHCHNLEHEDHGMMLNFEVKENSTGVDSIPNRPQKLDLN
ncbi:MAG: bilirubin oxidase [Chlorobi bacterium CHB2]|nr:bilirubin oxidase [Chlorobi bacterium CHB2]